MIHIGHIWITKTFLITTVFSIGTSFFGIGIYQGLSITAVHTLILQVYYQWFAPVGLPQEPEWLDFNKLWTTGIPTHYFAILCGYFIALWIWRRSNRNLYLDSNCDENENCLPICLTIYTLFVAVLAVIGETIITHLILRGSFPGITHIIQYLLVSYVFLYAWIIYVGLDLLAITIGSAMLSLYLLSYSMFLAPIGYPNGESLGSSKEVVSGISHYVPQYLGFNALWFKLLPGAFIAIFLSFIISRYLFLYKFKNNNNFSNCLKLLLLIFSINSTLFAPTAPGTEEGYKATASASGEAAMVIGSNPVDMKNTRPAQGDIKVSVVEMGTRWSHIQNIDIVNVIANFKSDNHTYEVKINKPMPRHPLGKYTTWNGVVLRHLMHGETGIGTAQLPKVKPDIALWGWAEVSVDGKVIAKMAPAHVMVITQEPQKDQPDLRGIMLEISTEEKDLVGVPDGYLTVMWHKIDNLTFPEREINTRQTIGWIVLIGLTILFGLLAQFDKRAIRNR